jgi:hypothetical protein
MKLCLTDQSIQTLEAMAGQTITGVFVSGPASRDLDEAPGFLAIAFANGAVFNIFPTSVQRWEDDPRGEYFRLEVESDTAPMALENSPGDFARWSVADQLMRRLVGDSVAEVHVVRERSENEGVIDIGVQLVTKREAKLYVSAEQAGRPLTLAIKLDGKIPSQ